MVDAAETKSAKIGRDAAAAHQSDLPRQSQTAADAVAGAGTQLAVRPSPSP